jgi:hypothetical protein
MYNLFGWVAQANVGPDGKSVLSPAKLNLIQDAVSAACSEKLGVVDSVVADPRACHFKPPTLLCRAGDSADCLTQAEVAATEKFYSGPVNSRGQRLFPGVPAEFRAILATVDHRDGWAAGDDICPELFQVYGLRAAGRTIVQRDRLQL